MPYAFLNPDGTIKLVVRKPTPFMKVLPALGSMWIGAHHTAFAHKDGKPTNLAWVYGLVYFGEHLHKEHHDKPRLVNYAAP